MECMKICRKKVDESSNIRAKLQQSLMEKEAELASLIASLGENTAYAKVGTELLRLDIFAN